MLSKFNLLCFSILFETPPKILPWFGQPGQGTQYKLPKSVQELLDPNNPYLKEIRNDKR
ncbi:glycohydrolase toxin TNT-related protein [Acinetobacter haemolyticus]|uniref:glycohydrolase toxin TNT-related protein n=1 Tax=Acinetobacter haemolyticus TaxID=29430 RepID=UPI0009B5EF87|nr:glycohydrolase toxin TNT-related protein [Acinetobacter haemolyticus]NAR61214.1 glycohydrolase toxin TNT-related protein [Acinetobacter haemolyticus]NAR68024.1 glycohydrolase toxin TNT-related protein [Acinetobacter haemolyticus]NAR71410.1 glycohydrolase toxin TNT-related protein [Acinetobacter haemolyticus]NAR83934.1 glycohydrolase toxin TNT-related protein [Acinetobacter haemolyticus]